MNAIKIDIDTEGALQATESVLDLSQEEYDFVAYTTTEESAHDKAVRISRFLYEELGSPQQITVRILPGDTLNEVQS